jgi:hypothetical protein
LVSCVSGGLISYSIPESKHGGDSGELQDQLYDGGRSSSSGWLTGGLGLLVDGQIGADNFRVDIGYGKGKYINLNTCMCGCVISRAAECSPAVSLSVNINFAVQTHGRANAKRKSLFSE